MALAPGHGPPVQNLDSVIRLSLISCAEYSAVDSNDSSLPERAYSRSIGHFGRIRAIRPSTKGVRTSNSEYLAPQVGFEPTTLRLTSPSGASLWSDLLPQFPHGQYIRPACFRFRRHRRFLPAFAI